MKSFRIRRRTWRFYRNWGLFMLMWLALVAALWLSPVWAVPIWALPAYILGSAIFYAYRITHPRVQLAMMKVTPADADMTYEKVDFPSRDELMLFGWYVPGENGAAVILVHGLGSRGITMIYHATALASRGYGVLLFDLRAHGSSEGDTCTGSWRETQDLLGAVDYVRGRGDVDADKIGGLGISLGAQIVLRTAARSEALAGVAAEGPGPVAFADHGRTSSKWRYWVSLPTDWLYYKVRAFMCGHPEPPALLDEIGQIAPRPVLLISTGQGSEQRFTRLAYEAATDPKELWEVPQAPHGGAFFAQPEEYAERIATFFDHVLLGQPYDEGEADLAVDVAPHIPTAQEV